MRSFRSSLSQLKLTVWVLFSFIPKRLPSSPLLHLSCFDFCTLQCVGLSNECKLKQSIEVVCGSCCECNSLKSGLLGASTNHLATIGPFHNEHVQTRMTLHFFGCMCLQLLQLSGFVTAEPGEKWGPCGGWKRGLRVHW